ncbi:AfsR/SARP family transcriptional regulator [Amycolatopsis sp. NPDC054798]
MEFRLLGPVHASENGRHCTPNAPKVRQVLTLLLARANQVVNIDTIIDELWGDHPPRSAVTTTQTYIYQLRKMFIARLGKAPGEHRIETLQPGYLLHVGPDELDVTVFDRLTAEAQRRQSAGDLHGCLDHTAKALALWSGNALSNVEAGRILQSYSTHLEDRRIDANELRIEAGLVLGRHRELIPELRSLVAAHPFNEWFHAQLIYALNKAGRRAAALEAYQSVRTLLADELGLAPSGKLQQVHQEVLAVEVAPAPRLKAVNA